ncbi:uncharacterized protein LOC117644748 [Thrips palmi]|uniref:Uncharacterized protein LOC117644748 n=1 Tax=Thrips palmi TaxID=161013 RepID=A0A6P8YK55_THRPL|nr:uncharacterized protein LOC117644748 [Thrips palmi]
MPRTFSTLMAKELRVAAKEAMAGRADWLEDRPAKTLSASFQILNLVRQPVPPMARASAPLLQQATHQTDEVVDAIDEEGETVTGMWRGVGRVLGRVVDLDTIVWPGGDLVVPGLSARARSVFRIVTALAPPFVMEAELDEDGQCLRGLPCHRLLTRGKDNLTLVFSELETQEREDAEEVVVPEDVVDVPDYPQDEPKGEPRDDGPASTESTAGADAGGGRTDHDRYFMSDRGDSEEQFDLPRYKYRTNCCYGLAMDLLENIAHELEFDFHLYVVSDGVFGSQVHEHQHHNHKPYYASGQPQHTQQSHHLEQDLQPKNAPPPAGQHGQHGQHGQQGAEQAMHDAEQDQRLQHHQKQKYSPGGEQRPQRSRVNRESRAPGLAPPGRAARKWNGIVGDLTSGAAHMSFAALSVSSSRSEVMDFSVPFFYSGVSFLAAPTQKSEIPLHAFLLPFSPELWIAIFLSLNLTAIAVAVYEWLSPFGLNPWGRQRSKNFSIASALWVMWGLLCGHLVAFKAPKSWPNKFLINVWGGFSVLFVASYTANIAALIAGLFFHNAVSNYHDRSLLSQKVGAPRHSAADYYVHRANPHLWEHMQRFSVATVEEGVHRLRNGTLDILIADTPILDYYRATDHGCKLQKIGDAINEDTYAVGMAKGFPLKDSVSAVIAKYTNNGYMDILQEKWYGGLPCFKLANDMAQPRPLGVAAVAGVFILLGLGMAVGILILVVEHLFYKYTLPLLRHKPKGTIWKSRNIMFFSQKLYRFINCVELVSPHHAARELVHTLRQGQITSLFQKSVKRKEHEQRRRRKSKAQFFEMIQEIRRVQQEERAEGSAPGEEGGDSVGSPGDGPSLRPDGQRRRSKSPCASRLDIARRLSRELFSRSPKGDEAGSRSSLSVRRFSSEAALSPRLLGAAVGRRLSKGSTSPPDLNSRRASHLDSVGAKLNPIGESGASRSASRLFNGRNGNNGGGSSSTTVVVVGPVPEPPAPAIPADTTADTLLEETEEDEEACKASLDAGAAAVASRRHPGKAKGAGKGGKGRPGSLHRLSRDELLGLSRCSEAELREHLVRAIREKDGADPP